MKAEVQFSEQDLELFSQASGDNNPLHCSRLYAGQTAYGQPVVFGALGCLACLGAVPPSTKRIKRIAADFQRPLFMGVRYQVETRNSPDGVVIRLLDGSIPVLSTAVQFAPDEALPVTRTDGGPHVPRSEARVLQWKDLSAGDEIEGLYRSQADAVSRLSTRWSLHLDPLVTEAVLWSSYFVGMELPGRNALFFRMALDFHYAELSQDPIVFHSKVIALNKAVAQARMGIELRSADKLAVSGQLTAFVRPELEAPAFELAGLEADRSQAFAGKIALVVGASRGLGAALSAVFAAEGAEVIALARSGSPWASQLSPELSKRIIFTLGDASNLALLSALEAEISGRFGGLDYLVCTAFPPIPSLRLELNAVGRIESYVSESVSMVLRPLCAFLPALSRRKGCTVLISSVAVERPVRDWPHYIAAKNAIESLASIGTLQYPETSALIVRPNRLLTEMTNTPMGRRGATSPALLAEQISRRLATPLPAGSCEIFDGQEAVPTTEAAGQLPIK